VAADLVASRIRAMHLPPFDRAERSCVRTLFRTWNVTLRRTA